MTYIIVGRDTCRWCNQARQLLEENKYKYDYINSQELNSKHKYYKYIPTDYNFIPKILFMDKKKVTWIGGYEALVAHLSKIKKSNQKKNKKKKSSKKKKLSKKK